MATVTLTINGQEVVRDVENRRLLVQLLREDLRLTGTHVGCDTTQCGCCTVLMNGDAVKSCTVLAQQADGATIVTIEGIGTASNLHPVQQAFHEKHGLQCGFCTPGMVMNSVDLLQKNSSPTEQDVRHWLEGNLCRCTGYHNIVEAVLHAAETIKAKA